MPVERREQYTFHEYEIVNLAFFDFVLLNRTNRWRVRDYLEGVMTGRREIIFRCIFGVILRYNNICNK